MRRLTATLLLLAALAVGVIVGPHPCLAETAAAEAPRVERSCHEPAVPQPDRPAPGDDDDQGRGTERLLCERACHAVAVLGIEPVLATAAPLAETAAPAALPAVPLLALTIDHVPLS